MYCTALSFSRRFKHRWKTEIVEHPIYAPDHRKRGPLLVHMPDVQNLYCNAALQFFVAYCSTLLSSCTVLRCRSRDDSNTVGKLRSSNIRYMFRCFARHKITNRATPAGGPITICNTNNYAFLTGEKDSVIQPTGITNCTTPNLLFVVVSVLLCHPMSFTWS